MALNIFNKTVSTQRPSLAVGSSGDLNYTFASNIATLTCRIQIRSSSELVYTDKDTLFSDAVLYCDVDKDILADDRVIDGVIEYEVKGTDPNHDNADTYMRVDLLKVG